MSAETHLTSIQTKVLIALARSKFGSLNTDEILDQTGIATSTWSAEQGRLVAMGLIKKQMIRVIELNHISKRMSYGLTDKGRMVGLNLLNITKILATDNENSKLSAESSLPNLQGNRMESASVNRESVEFNDKISECVEIALDSFGTNLVDLVKNSLEVDHQIAWSELSENTQVFEEVLKDYFGLGASEKLKKLIIANIKSRFDLRGYQNEDLIFLISEARKTNQRGHITNSVVDANQGVEARRIN